MACNSKKGKSGCASNSKPKTEKKEEKKKESKKK